MTDPVAQRVQRYILDGSDDDLKRLVTASALLAESSRSALRRSGIQAGWSVIECGCGPIGALTVLAELAGQAGRVVGVELNPAAVRRAQSVVDTLGLENVQVIAGDVNELEIAAVGGPFDLAFTRLFLMHQPDPVGLDAAPRSALALNHRSNRDLPGKSQLDLAAGAVVAGALQHDRRRRRILNGHANGLVER